jgi:hypothetical protein
MHMTSRLQLRNPTVFFRNDNVRVIGSFVSFVSLIRRTHKTKYERTIHETNERTWEIHALLQFILNSLY